MLEIDDEKAGIIAEALKVNSSLKSIHLAFKQIGPCAESEFFSAENLSHIGPQDRQSAENEFFSTDYFSHVQ